MPSFDATDGIVFDIPGEGNVRPSGELDVIGSVPLLVDKVWRNGVLLNSVEADTPAWALYRDEEAPTRVNYRRWTERYPSGGPTANAMPKANVATTWGDFLVLGDIMWKADPSEPLSAENAARYPHGLWYSEPGAFDSWDALEVEFVGQRDGDNRIVGMFPVEAGLLVTSQSSVYMLRGTPDDHLYEDLRVGVGPKCRCSVAYWPLAGVVIWIDARGQVWQTNGERFGRLDTVLPEYDYSFEGRDDALAVLDKHVVVSRAGRTYALRLVDDGGAAWTELNAPYATGMARLGGSMYIRSEEGLFRWAPEVLSLRGNRSEVAGTFGDEQVVTLPVDSRVATRTLAGEDPHAVTFWHRFGARTDGGALLSATAYAGPLGADPSVEYPAPGVDADRSLAVWPGHGPSVEATFAVEGEGDVAYESVSVWAHRGRPSR